MIERNWSSVVAAVAVIALAACGGGDAANDAADTAPPATEPAPSTEAPATTAELPEGVTPDMVARGKVVFETTICFTCHGADGSGTVLAPNLRDQTWINTDGSYEGIVEIVTNGVPTPKEATAPMPPRGGAPLTDDQVREVAAYVYTLSRGG